MKKWEYKFVFLVEEKHENQLNELGKKGWELISVVYSVGAYFKREII